LNDKQLQTFKTKLHHLSTKGTELVPEDTIINTLAKYSIRKLNLAQALAIAFRRVSVTTQE
jgi:hypothetical protein